ncbi:MAG: hypothetical protein AAGB46_15895 [Verrucomicrobiota bacterium]
MKPTAKIVLLALIVFVNLVSAKLQVEELIHRPPGAFYESVAMDSKGALYLNERQTHTVFRVRVYGLIEDWAHAPAGGVSQSANLFWNPHPRVTFGGELLFGLREDRDADEESALRAHFLSRFNF